MEKKGICDLGSLCCGGDLRREGWYYVLNCWVQKPTQVGSVCNLQVPYKACLFTGFTFTGSWCGAFQWSTTLMETQIRPYFSSEVRHPGGTHQITSSDWINQQIHLCHIYISKVFAFSQRRCNPQFLIQFPLCAMWAGAPSTVCKVFIWARRSSNIC